MQFIISMTMSMLFHHLMPKCHLQLGSILIFLIIGIHLMTLVWQQPCWPVDPLESCTCPGGLKCYSCKPLVSLRILFNL